MNQRDLRRRRIGEKLYLFGFLWAETRKYHRRVVLVYMEMELKKTKHEGDGIGQTWNFI